jgi:hypothetical protein
LAVPWPFGWVQPIKPKLQTAHVRIETGNTE